MAENPLPKNQLLSGEQSRQTVDIYTKVFIACKTLLNTTINEQLTNYLLCIGCMIRLVHREWKQKRGVFSFCRRWDYILELSNGHTKKIEVIFVGRRESIVKIVLLSLSSPKRISMQKSLFTCHWAEEIWADQKS